MLFDFIDIEHHKQNSLSTKQQNTLGIQCKPKQMRKREEKKNKKIFYHSTIEDDACTIFNIETYVESKKT